MIAVLSARLRTAVSKKPHEWIFALLKAVVLLGLGWAIYHQVWAREDLDGLLRTFLQHWAGAEKWYFLAALLLVPVNWGLETLKWRSVLQRLTPVSFLRSFRAVLAGVAVSLFTPNRMGEYGGRILAVEVRHGWKAVFATLVGSMSQLLVLFSAGLLGLALFSSLVVFEHPSLLPWLLGSSIALTIVLGVLFLRLHRIPKGLQQLPFFGRIRRPLRMIALLRRLRRRDLARVLVLAALRYLTYSAQYFLLLRFVGIDLLPLQGFAGISTLFLFQTSLPLPPVIGLLARGEAALFVWGQFGGMPLAVLTASFGLFILNLTVPALLGGIVIVQTNVSKLLGYEKDEVKVDVGRA